MTREIARPERRRSRLRLAYFAGICASLAFVSAQSLYAQARESALAFGAELSQLGELGAQAEALLINGQRFQHAVLVSDGEPAQLLDRAQAECARQPGPFGAALAQLAERAARSGAEPASALRSGVLRAEAADRGMITCFGGAGGASLAELAERISELVRTGRLGAIGSVRYVYAQRSAPGQSRVTALWTDEGLDPGAMFPAAGDAPGSDSPLLPRPPESRRLLSAAAAGTPFLLLHYAARLPAPELWRFYAPRLSALGFERVAAAGDAAAYRREDGEQLFLALIEQDGSTLVALIEDRAGWSGVEIGE
jgi:hypothetical protein